MVRSAAQDGTSAWSRTPNDRRPGLCCQEALAGRGHPMTPGPLRGGRPCGRGWVPEDSEDKDASEGALPQREQRRARYTPVPPPFAHCSQDSGPGHKLQTQAGAPRVAPGGSSSPWGHTAEEHRPIQTGSNPGATCNF